MHWSATFAAGGMLPLFAQGPDMSRTVFCIISIAMTIIEDFLLSPIETQTLKRKVEASLIYTLYLIVQRDKRIRHKFNNLDSLLAKFLLEKALYVFPIQTYVKLWLANGGDHICFSNRHKITTLRGSHNDLLSLS